MPHALADSRAAAPATARLAHEEGVCSLAWSPDGRLLASGGNGGDVLLWRRNGTTLHSPAALAGHAGSVRALAWSPDGRRLLSGAEDRRVVVWSVEDARSIVRHVRHEDYVNGLGWDPGGSWYASAGRDGRLVVYDARTHSPRAELESPLGNFTSLACARSGRWLAASARTSEITVWRTSDWHLHRRLEAGAAVVWTVAWTADERLVSGGEDGALRVWDVEDRRCTQAIDAHSGTIARVAPAARSPIVATLGHDERLAVWSLEDGTLLGVLDDAYPGWVGCLDAHPVDDLVATPDSRGRSVRVLPLESVRGRRGPTATARLRRAVVEARADGRLAADGAAIGAGGLHAAALRLEDEDAALLLARTETLFVRPDAVDRLERELIPLGPHVTLRRLPDSLLRRHLDPCADFDRELVETALAHRVIARRRGWASRGPDGLVLHLASSPLFAQLVATTLFDSFSLGRDRLALRARDGSEWIAFPDGLVALGRADPASSDLLVRLVRRLLGEADVRSEAVAPESPPEWRTWDVPAPEAWPLRLDELLSMGERALPTLVERIDDERARQLRLLTLPARRRRGRHDVVILHAADDRQRAREVGAELEDLGLLAWIGDGGRGEPSADEWATMAEHAGAVAILLGRGAGRAWREQPFVPAYEELLRRREHGGPRLRWLPLVLPEASPAPRLPDFLRGFDSLRWHDEPRAERRRSLVDLTAAVLVDRVRL